jgi:hypothetical protein
MEMTRFCLKKGGLRFMREASRFREGKDLYGNDQILFELGCFELHVIRL